MDMSLGKFQELVMDREAWSAAIHGVAKSRTQLRVTLWTSNSTSGYVPQRTESKDLNRHLYINVQSSITWIVKKWKQSERPPTDEWINKAWHTHTTEYYASLKMNGILTQAAAWMNLLNTRMLSEISLTEKDKYCMTPLRTVKFPETEIPGVARGWGGKIGMGSNYLAGTEIWLGRWKSPGGVLWWWLSSTVRTLENV